MRGHGRSSHQPGPRYDIGGHVPPNVRLIIRSPTGWLTHWFPARKKKEAVPEALLYGAVRDVMDQLLPLRIKTPVMFQPGVEIPDEGRAYAHQAKAVGGPLCLLGNKAILG